MRIKAYIFKDDGNIQIGYVELQNLTLEDFEKFFNELKRCAKNEKS